MVLVSKPPYVYSAIPCLDSAKNRSFIVSNKSFEINDFLFEEKTKCIDFNLCFSERLLII